MGIGEGLLGFVQGASASLGAAAAKQVESDIDLERQLSLEQIAHQRNKARTYEQIRLMQEGLDPDDPLREIDPNVGVEGFKTIADRMEDRRKREAEETAAGTLRQFEEDPDSVSRTDAALAAEARGIELDDLLDEGVEPLTSEQLDVMTQFIPLEREEIQALRGAGIMTNNTLASVIQSELAKADKGAETNTRLLVRKDTGARIEVPVDTAVQLLSLNDDGVQLFETGKVETIDGKTFVVTPSRRIPVPTEGETGGTQAANLLDQIQARNRGDTAIGKRLAENNMEFVNPVALTGQNDIAALRGPVSGIAAFMGGRPVVGDLIEAATDTDLSAPRNRASSQVANLIGQSRVFFGAEGTRPLGAVLENLLNQLESPNALQGLITRDSKTYTQLGTLRRNVKLELERQRDLATAEDIGSKAQSEAARMVRVGTGILETVDTMFANKLVDESQVRLTNGDMIDVSELSWEDRTKVDTGWLDRNPKADLAATLWLDKLKLENQGQL